MTDINQENVTDNRCVNNILPKNLYVRNVIVQSKVLTLSYTYSIRHTNLDAEVESLCYEPNINATNNVVTNTVNHNGLHNFLGYSNTTEITNATKNLNLKYKNVKALVRFLCSYKNVN